MSSQVNRADSPYSEEEAHSVVASFFQNVTREDICGYVVLGVPRPPRLTAFLAADTGDLPQLAGFLSLVLYQLLGNMEEQPEEWQR